MSAQSAGELQNIYEKRFAGTLAYRKKIWNVLVHDFFQKYVSPDDAVVDLGCGYGEFINTVQCAKKFAMDLNPDAPKYLAPAVQFLDQDCASPWRLESGAAGCRKARGAKIRHHTGPTPSRYFNRARRYPPLIGL
jgi:hypothetical protein